MPKKPVYYDGNVDQKALAAKRWEDFTNGQKVAQVTWGQVTGSLMWELIKVATEAGDAVMMAVSRDGGTLVLTVMAGDERPKFYATTAVAMDAHLTNIIGRYS